MLDLGTSYNPVKFDNKVIQQYTIFPLMAGFDKLWLQLSLSQTHNLSIYIHRDIVSNRNAAISMLG